MQEDDRLPRDRSAWPVHASRLGDESAGANATTADQRLAMMWELVTQAWAIAGRVIPNYERANAPGRVLSLHDAGDE